MPEGADEHTFDEDEWSFGEQQFASGELLRKNNELERLLAEEKRRSEGIKERETTKWKDRETQLKEDLAQAKKDYKGLARSQKEYFERLQTDLAGAKEDLVEADARYYEAMDELLDRDEVDELTREIFETHRQEVGHKYHSLLVQAQIAERRWLLAVVVFKFLVDMMGGESGTRPAGVTVSDMDLSSKALLINCKDSMLHAPALPVWHKSLKEHLEDRTAREILAAHFKGEKAILELDEDVTS